MKLRVALLAVFFAVLAWFGAGTEVLGQQFHVVEPRKFDEFSKASHCDLTARLDNFAIQLQYEPDSVGHIVVYGPEGEGLGTGKDRKSTRLNSSHLVISYAVFCLKKKKNK